MPFPFHIIGRDSKTAARLGCLPTRHGSINTPEFMPVGTQATVKGLTPLQLQSIGVQVLLGNTYHLNLRPGSALIRQCGGLHQFMGWDGPILTDSGGFQAFSLSSLTKIDETGITFKSHLNGSPCFLGPREVIHIQQELGSDIAMVIDECPPYPCQYQECQTAIDRTLKWAEQCLYHAEESNFIAEDHHLFAIVQGSNYEDLRRKCAQELAALNFSGYAIGGVSVGEPESMMIDQVAATTHYLPEQKPRYVMGVGTPPQLLKLIALGVDLFDCVMPTRTARHGSAYTPYGRINLRNRRFRDDFRPLVEGLDNYTCKQFSRAYLRHLIIAEELLGSVLLTLHNVHFYLDLMKQARLHLKQGDYASWHQQWIKCYESGSED